MDVGGDALAGEGLVDGLEVGGGAGGLAVDAVADEDLRPRGVLDGLPGGLGLLARLGEGRND